MWVERQSRKGVQVEAGAAHTFDVDWKPDKMGSSLPSLPLPSTDRNWRGAGPCHAAAGCFEKLHIHMYIHEKHKNTLVHWCAHKYTVAPQPLSVCQNVSQDVLAPANQARDSAWQTPPQRESSCHLDKWTLEEWGGVCMFVQPFMCVSGFTPVHLCWSIGMCIIKMTCRWLVWVFSFFFLFLSCWPVIPWLIPIRKWINASRAWFLWTSFLSRKSSGKHCQQSRNTPAAPTACLDAEQSLKWHWLYTGNNH